MKSTTFSQDYAFSDSANVQRAADRALRRFFPNAANVYRAGSTNDKRGVDFWVELPGRLVAVDVKARRRDRAAEGVDDVCLEVWSDVDGQRVGWTRDTEKLTDYVLYLWLDTGRSMLLDFRVLLPWFTRNWESLWPRYGSDVRPSGTYRSQVVFIPSAELRDELARWQGLPVTKAA